MEILRICAFGHRYFIVTRKIEAVMTKLIRELLHDNEIVELFIGRNGDFDIDFTRYFKIVRQEGDYRSAYLNLVLPYHVKDEDLFDQYYDSIVMPISPKTHYKAAIRERNRWMVDNSDLVICYLTESSGGTYDAIAYAKRCGKRIINIKDLLEDDDE